MVVANTIKTGGVMEVGGEPMPVDPASGARFVVQVRRQPRNLFHLVCLRRPQDAGAVSG